MSGAAIRAVVDSVLGPDVFLWTPSRSLKDGSPVVIGSDRNRQLTAGIKISGADDDLQIVELYDAPVQVGEEPSALAMAIIGALVPEAETWIRSQPALDRPEVRSFDGLHVVWAGDTSINDGRYLVLVISARPIPTGK
jgi:hypothetical protein